MAKQDIPAVYQNLPVLSAEEVRRRDRLASEKFGVPAERLMENAGRAVAEEASRYIRGSLKRDIQGCPVVVCCGRGANGGDGLVAARHLQELGAKVSVFICPPKKEADYPRLTAVNLGKTQAAGAAVVTAGLESGLAEALKAAAVVLDALLGTGSSGKPAGAVHHMIQEITRSKKPVIAVDIPSGLNPDTGYHSGVFITAAETLALGFPKRGLLAPHAKKHVGELRVLDIGYPADLLG